MMAPKRVAIMARQSLTKKDSTSISTQVDALTTHWNEQGARIVATLRAENTRGWKEKRDDIDAVLALGDQRAIDVVSFWSLDRLARTVRQQEVAIHELSKRGVTIHSLREPWASDPSPEMRQMAAIWNERFSRDLSARLKGVAQNHFRAGILHSTAPYGYRKLNREALIVPDAAEVVKWIYDRYRQGAGSSLIAEELTAKGVPTPANGKGWRHDVILRILRNPVYIGIQRANGAMMPGNWQPIIDRAVFDEVQELLVTGRHPSTSHEGRSWLQRISYHECGARMYMHGGNHAQRPNGETYVWFYFCCSRAYTTVDRCTIRPKAIARIKFENATKAHLLADVSNASSWQDALGVAMDRFADRNVLKVLAKLERKREQLIAEQERVRSWFIKGRMSDEEATEHDDRLNAELDANDVEIGSLKLPPTEDSYRAAADGLASLQRRLTGEIPPDTLRQAFAILRARPTLTKTGPAIRYPTVIADLLGCPDRSY